MSKPLIYHSAPSDKVAKVAPFATKHRWKQRDLPARAASVSAETTVMILTYNALLRASQPDGNFDAQDAKRYSHGMKDPKRATVYFDPKVHRALSRKAAASNRSISHVVKKPFEWPAPNGETDEEKILNRSCTANHC